MGDIKVGDEVYLPAYGVCEGVENADWSAKAKLPLNKPLKVKYVSIGSYGDRTWIELEGYRFSHPAKKFIKVMKERKGKRMILVGAAGSGKDYLRDRLVGMGYTPDISVTTRPMRDGEEHGKTYFYIGDEEYDKLHKDGLLYEAVQFNGWKYGTKITSWHESDIFIMTPSGVHQISPEDRKDCLIIFLDIPEGIRRSRVAKRSDADSVERRIEADRKDFAGFTDYDLKISNPDF